MNPRPVILPMPDGDPDMIYTRSRKNSSARVSASETRRLPTQPSRLKKKKTTAAVYQFARERLWFTGSRCHPGW